MVQAGNVSTQHSKGGRQRATGSREPQAAGSEKPEQQQPQPQRSAPRRGRVRKRRAGKGRGKRGVPGDAGWGATPGLLPGGGTRSPPTPSLRRKCTLARSAWFAHVDAPSARYLIKATTLMLRTGLGAATLTGRCVTAAKRSGKEGCWPAGTAHAGGSAAVLLLLCHLPSEGPPPGAGRQTA